MGTSDLKHSQLETVGNLRTYHLQPKAVCGGGQGIVLRI